VSQNFLVTAFSVKDAFEKLKESLSTLMVDYVVPSITVSPIIEIFPYREELDKEISRRPLEESDNIELDETTSNSKVFSAPGSDVEDVYDDEEIDSEVEDNYSEEN